ncbi:MAG: glucose-6-phosphate isomerase [Gammaproteobacteria bacterium]
MSEDFANPLQTAAWKALEEHAGSFGAASIADLLDQPGRNDAFIHCLDGLYVDFSRSHASHQTLSLLLQLADELKLTEKTAAMFAGEHLNRSEGRAALHTALRGEAEDLAVSTQVSEEQEKFLAFADAVRSGAHTGHDGRRIRRVINIGIGGSDLGPRMISSALETADEPVDVFYVAAIDGIELEWALHAADPTETLFIVCSKTFSTLETRANADRARQWLLSHLPAAALGAHFAAISTNDAAMDEFGIAADKRFRIWDWVGGRYSLWSAVGLAAAISIGTDRFRELLIGAAAMDQHFRSAAPEKNIPLLAGLLSVWEQSFLGADQHVVLPYDQRLELLPAWLQQLFMESLGKGARQGGDYVDYTTGAALWGGPGSNAQHSFAQWLHQGTGKVHVDYIGVVKAPGTDLKEAFVHALGNMLAQSETLARGRSEQVVQAELEQQGLPTEITSVLVPQKVHPGSRPSNILLLRQLSAHNLGMMLAFYEHQVFVQAMLWGINPFDQWGVELGKQTASDLSVQLLKRQADGLPAAGKQILDWQDD